MSIRNDPDSTQEEVKYNNPSNQNKLSVNNNLFHLDLIVKQEPDLNDENLLTKNDICYSKLITKHDFGLQQESYVKSEPVCEEPPIKTKHQENIDIDNCNPTQEKITFSDNNDKQKIVFKNGPEQDLLLFKNQKAVIANLMKYTDFKIKTVRDLRRVASKIYEQYSAKTLEKVNGNSESLVSQNSCIERKDKVEFICNLCGRGLRNKVLLVRHIKRHTTRCKECRNFFNSLQNHICKPKLPPKIHKCDHCEKIWHTASGLQNHVRIHTGEKPFTCHVCDKKFNANTGLKKHLKIHTGEKPYQCNHCNKSFSRSDHLQNHSLVHSGVKPHKCDICDKSFTQSFALRNHKLRHTGEKQFKCHICEKAFRIAGSMKKHVLRVHSR